MSFDLYHGDCLEVMPLVVPDASINLVLADLPYGTTNLRWDSIIPLAPLWAEYERVLAPGGCVVLFASMPFTSTLYESNPKWYRDHLVWDKNKCGSPGLANVRPMRTHEDVLIFSPGSYTYNPQMESGEPYARKSSKAGGYVGRKNDHGYGLQPKTEFKNEGTRYPKSVQYSPRDFSAQQQVHPTQKPVPWLRWLIRTYSNPGDRVLDNVVGSGSTILACLEEGRHCVAIEREADYLAISEARIMDAVLGGLA